MRSLNHSTLHCPKVQVNRIFVQPLLHVDFREHQQILGARVLFNQLFADCCGTARATLCQIHLCLFKSAHAASVLEPTLSTKIVGHPRSAAHALASRTAYCLSGFPSPSDCQSPASRRLPLTP